MVKILLIALSLCASGIAWGSSSQQNDYLIKVKPEFKAMLMSQVNSMGQGESNVEDLQFDNWLHIKVGDKFAPQFAKVMAAQEGVEYVQPNYKIRLLDNPQLAKLKAQDSAEDCPVPDEFKFLCEILGGGDGGGGLPTPGDPGDGGGLPVPGDPGNGGSNNPAVADNPPIPSENKTNKVGPDPLFDKQWGMNDIGVKEAWSQTRGNEDMIVAVIDTGVDYTHEDLAPNLWRNPNEIPDNNIDDDNNGYVDDVVGWDFVSNDNKPYDLKGNILGGGNPGHGTHCAGNVAARGDNTLGISGVAPNVKIMVLRFISDQGQGTTADAIKAVRYAVDNGAKISSNSWGSEGEDPGDSEGNKALRDVITYAKDKGSLFIAAAGNGHQGRGYDNDTDSRPGYPASYDHDNIISVAAIDVNDRLGSFSNWGRKSVDIAAPGVKVFSTVVGNGYEDTLLFGLATWDGTSMATPHVAGAAALYWSKHPEATYDQVKAAILSSAAKLPSLSNKVVSGGKLDVKALMQQ